jgi:hypothetical protein
MYRRTHLVALVAAGALAACSADDTVSPAANAVASPKLAGRAYHQSHLVSGGLTSHTIAPLRFQSPIAVTANGGVPAASAKSAAGAAESQPDIQYWGGAVIPAQKVALIYYSPKTIFTNGPQPGSAGVGQADGSLVGQFLNNIGGTPYFNINSTYYERGKGGRTFVQNSVRYTSFWADNAKDAPNAGDVVTQDEMVAVVETGFANGSLQYDPNTVYMIVTGPGVNLGGGFSHNNLQYCAFHSGYWFNDGGPIVQFGAMPYDADFNTRHSAKGFICTYLTKGPNGDLGADATVSALTHEIEETATDPVSLTTSPFFAGWYDSQGEENADKCAYTYGPTLTTNSLDYWNITVAGKPFMVQQNWTNVQPQGCLIARN